MLPWILKEIRYSPNKSIVDCLKIEIRSASFILLQLIEYSLIVFIRINLALFVLLEFINEHYQVTGKVNFRVNEKFWRSMLSESYTNA